MDERQSNLPLRIYLGCVAFSLAGSTISRVWNLSPGIIAPTASLATLAAGVVALFQPVLRTRRQLAAILATACFGGAMEAVGLATGLPFGRYAYTDRWSPTISFANHRFPALLPLAWLLVAGGCFMAVEPTFRKRPLIHLLVTAVLASMVDLVMEPVMVGVLGYWRWIDHGPLPGGAPWTNLFGWLATSFGAAAVLRTGGLRSSSTGPRWVIAGYMALVFGLAAVYATNS